MQFFPVQIQPKVLLNPGTNPADLLAQNLISPPYPVSTHWVTAEHGQSQLQPQLIQHLTPEEAGGQGSQAWSCKKNNLLDY